MTRTITHAALIATFCALPLLAQGQEVAAPQVEYNAETGLPYGAPGRGIVDYDALIRRELIVLERQFGAFRDASRDLAETAHAACAGTATIQDLTDATRTAWLAWAPIDSYQFGPMEHTGAALTVNFWPDKRGFVAAGVAQLRALPADQQATAEGVAQVSAAGQGLPALATLLTDEAPACPAAEGVAENLEHMGASLYDAWFSDGGWADIARSAGPDNPVYLAPFEFTKEIYSALDFSLIRAGDQRLGRPMGDERGGQPRRVDGYQLGIGIDLLHAQMNGVAEMIEHGFAGDVTEPDRAWVVDVVDQVHARLDRIGMPLRDAVVDPDARWRVGEALNKVQYLIEQMDRDIGPELGVETGFSPADGD